MLKKNKEKTIKGRSVTYTYWDDVGEPITPLTQELMAELWEKMDKPSKYLYLMARESRIDRIIIKIILTFIKILDSITGCIINTQTKLLYYLWRI